MLRPAENLIASERATLRPLIGVEGLESQFDPVATLQEVTIAVIGRGAAALIGFARPHRAKPRFDSRESKDFIGGEALSPRYGHQIKARGQFVTNPGDALLAGSQIGRKQTLAPEPLP